MDLINNISMTDGQLELLKTICEVTFNQFRKTSSMLHGLRLSDIHVENSGDDIMMVVKHEQIDPDVARITDMERVTTFNGWLNNVSPELTERYSGNMELIYRLTSCIGNSLITAKSTVQILKRFTNFIENVRVSILNIRTNCDVFVLYPFFEKIETIRFKRGELMEHCVTMFSFQTEEDHTNNCIDVINTYDMYDSMSSISSIENKWVIDWSYGCFGVRDVAIMPFDLYVLHIKKHNVFMSRPDCFEVEEVVKDDYRDDTEIKNDGSIDVLENVENSMVNIIRARTFGQMKRLGYRPFFSEQEQKNIQMFDEVQEDEIMTELDPDKKPRDTKSKYREIMRTKRNARKGK